MAQQRKFLITSTHVPAFDGSTKWTGGWSQGNGGATSPVNNGKFNVATTSGLVGRFTPAALGRTRNLAALIRPYCNGPVVEGDTYSVRSSTSAADGRPVNIVREPARALTQSLQQAQPLLVGPTDDFCVELAGDGTAASVHLIVDDLSEEEWMALSTAMAVAGDGCCDVETRVLEVPAELASWTGTLFVQATSDDPGEVLVLPSITEVAPGATVLVWRDGGAWFQVEADGAETINTTTGPVVFAGDGEGVLFRASAQGWTSVASAAPDVPVVVAGTATLDAPTTRHTLIQWTPSAGTLTLPDLADVALGQELEINVQERPTGAALIAPAAGEALDGIVDNTLTVGEAGDNIRLRRVAESWLSLTNAPLGYEERTLRLPQTLDPWEGTLVVLADAVVGGVALTLPPLDDVSLGSKLWISRQGGLWFRVAADGTETINGSVEPLVIAVDHQGVVLHRGVSTWVATLPAEEHAVLEVAGQVELDAFDQAVLEIHWDASPTPAGIQLPPVADTAVGQELIIVCTVRPVVRGYIYPLAGDFLNGTDDPDLINVGVVNVQDTVRFRRVPSGWVSTEMTQLVDIDSSTAAVDPLLTIGWRGLRTQRCVYGAGGGDYTLPPPAALFQGCQLLIWVTNAQPVVVQGNGSTIIAGGLAAATSMALTQNRPVLLTYVGGSLWIGVGKA